MGRWSRILIIFGFLASPAIAQGPIGRPMIGLVPGRLPIMLNPGQVRPPRFGGHHGGGYSSGGLGSDLGVDSLALSLLDGGVAPAETEASMPVPDVIPGIGGPCMAPQIIELDHRPRPAVTTRVVYGLPPSCP